MKFLNFQRVLCISPHPDDVEYGMMGTIKKYKGTKFDILCLTEGGDYDVTTAKSRLDEVARVWKEDIGENINLLFTDKKYLKELGQDGWVNYIETHFICVDHDCIFVPTADDSHFEHKFVNELSYPLTRIKDLSIIEYRTPSTQDTWTPNLFVDITEQFESKYTQLQRFTSQKHRWYFKKDLIKSFHSNYQSYKKGIKYVEKFKARQLYRL